MRERVAKSPFFLKLFETFIPWLSWIIITLPLWLSFFHPAIVAYLIIAFDFYFFVKSGKTVYNAVLSYRAIQLAQKIPYKNKIKGEDSRALEHFILIPNYKEQVHKLKETIDAITASDYPYKSLYLVLAFE